MNSIELDIFKNHPSIATLLELFLFVSLFVFAAHFVTYYFYDKYKVITDKVMEDYRDKRLLLWSYIVLILLIIVLYVHYFRFSSPNNAILHGFVHGLVLMSIPVLLLLIYVPSWDLIESMIMILVIGLTFSFSSQWLHYRRTHHIEHLCKPISTRYKRKY